MPIIRVNVEGKDGRGRKIPAPNALRDMGPLFPIIVAPLDSHAEVLKKAGKRVVQGKGMALIDTGAARTAVDIKTARTVGLPIKDSAIMSSASHSRIDVPVFAGKLSIPDFADIDVPTGLMGVNLDGHTGVVALIGRDLLEAAILIYDGGAGTISISL